MLVSGEKAYNSEWRRAKGEKITLVANGDIQLYYNPAYETILIVDKNKMLKLEMDSGFLIFGAMVQRLVLGDYSDCWEFHDGFLSFNEQLRDSLSKCNLREMYVGSKKFAMNA